MNYNKLEYVLKHNEMIHDTYRFCGSAFFKIVGKFIVTDEKMILFTGHGKRFNDSPKEIYLYMVNHGLDRQYHCVWAVDDISKYDIPGQCDVIVMDTEEYFVTALKAKYWCCCVNIERGLQFKKKETVFLNTWHCVPTNYMGNAVSGRHDFNWKKTDYICCSGEYEKPLIIRDCCAYKRNLIETGLPRNDALWHATEETKIQMREKLNIPKEKKVILYAPTWRDSSEVGGDYEITPPIDWQKWENFLGDDYCILLRTHAYTTKLNGVTFDDFVIDCCEYPDVNDLMIAADIMISDYSSIIFDYCILERPIICFGYDYESYSKGRGFYFNLDKEFPSGILKNQDQVLSYIDSMDYENECQKTAKMKNKFVLYGGNATEQCVKYLLGK